MGKVNAWMMEQEELVGAAIEHGAKYVEDVVEYVEEHCANGICKDYVRKVYGDYNER